MKIRNSNVDIILYIIACIISFGVFWLLRILISQAIRSAIED